MLWTIIVLLIILWAWGFATQIAGGMIHLLLAAAVAVWLIKIMLSDRRSVI